MNASVAGAGIVDYLCAAYLVQGIELANGAAIEARSIAAVADMLGRSYAIAIPEAVQTQLLERLAADGVVEPVEDAYAKGFFFTTEQGLRDAWQRLYLRKGSVAENARRLGSEWLMQVFANAEFGAALAAAAPGAVAAAPTRPVSADEAAADAVAAAAPATPDGAGDATGDGEAP